MRKKLLLGIFICLGIIGNLPIAFAKFDQDHDGITDAHDNCTLISNVSQLDSDKDGFGNTCDSDLNNDGLVDLLDKELLKEIFHSKDMIADINSNGVVNADDYQIFKDSFGGPPGPAGTNIPLFQHPRLHLTKDKITELKALFNQKPYRVFWNHVKTRALAYAHEVPPCPDNLATCESNKRISDYNESRIQTLGIKLPYMALAWLLTEEQIYLDGVHKLMRALASYENWASNKDTGTGYILMGMSIAYDWLYDQFEESERELYRSKMRHHANIFNDLFANSYKWAKAYLQNHNYTNATALAFTATALYGEVEEADDWLDTAHSNYQSVLNLLSPDGASHEGISYWGAGMRPLLEYFRAISRFDSTLDHQLTSSGYFKNATLYRLYASLPDFLDNVDYSDSTRSDFHGPGHILRGLASSFSDGLAQWLAERIETVRGKNAKYHWLDMIWHDSSIEPKSPERLPPYHYFKNMGILFARSAWSDTAFWSFYKSAPPQGFHAANNGYFGGSHVHPDQGQFLAWANGAWLAIDDGYVMRKRTQNHNTLLFNKVGQLGSDTKWFNGTEVKKNKGTVLPVFSSTSPTGQYIVTEMAQMYRKAAGVSNWQRSFISLPEGYQVIRDDIVLSEPGQIDVLMHSNEGTHMHKNNPTMVILNTLENNFEARDVTDNLKHGKMFGGQTTAGVAGAGARLSEEAEGLKIAGLNGNRFPENGSLSFWVKVDDSFHQKHGNLFDKYDKKRDHIFLRTFNTNLVGKTGLQIAFQKIEEANYLFSKNFNVSTDEWHHLVLTWDTQHSKGQVHIDGMNIWSAPIADSGWKPEDQLMSFGGGLKGSVDEIQLFDRILEANEIKTLNKLETISQGLIGFWKFDGLAVGTSTEYSYKLVYPESAKFALADYEIPPDERQKDYGNYRGVLVTTTLEGVAADKKVHLIHLLGNKSASTSYIESDNKLLIDHPTYKIEIDFETRQISHH